MLEIALLFFVVAFRYQVRNITKESLLEGLYESTDVDRHWRTGKTHRAIPCTRDLMHLV